MLAAPELRISAGLEALEQPGNGRGICENNHRANDGQSSRHKISRLHKSLAPGRELFNVWRGKKSDAGSRPVPRAVSEISAGGTGSVADGYGTAISRPLGSETPLVSVAYDVNCPGL